MRFLTPFDKLILLAASDCASESLKILAIALENRLEA
ncbi:MAG: hypothetical protein QOJ40_573 [Verrucomicrobiota bacterium]